MLLVFYFIPGALYPILSPKIAGGFVFSPVGKILFWRLVASFILLTWLGIIAAEPPFVGVSILITVIYFTIILLSFFVIHFGV